MTKGKKIYFVITSIIAILTVAIHLVAFGTFLDISINAKEGLGQGLSIVFTGIFWFVIGGAFTVSSIITSIFLLKVKKKTSVWYLITVTVTTIATFVCWYVVAKSLG